MTKQKFDPQELTNSKRIFKSATPKGDYSWYIKWAGSILILLAMSMRGAEGMIYTDLGLSLLGVFIIAFSSFSTFSDNCNITSTASLNLFASIKN